jgi:hypothetical protein
MAIRTKSAWEDAARLILVTPLESVPNQMAKCYRSTDDWCEVIKFLISTRYPGCHAMSILSTIGGDLGKYQALAIREVATVSSNLPVLKYLFTTFPVCRSVALTKEEVTHLTLPTYLVLYQALVNKEEFFGCITLFTNGLLPTGLRDAIIGHLTSRGMVHYKIEFTKKFVWRYVLNDARKEFWGLTANQNLIDSRAALVEFGIMSAINLGRSNMHDFFVVNYLASLSKQSVELLIKYASEHWQHSMAQVMARKIGVPYYYVTNRLEHGVGGKAVWVRETHRYDPYY